jgi:hypothetical protein
VAECYETERDAIFIVREGLSKRRAYDADLALSAEPRPHADRAVEQDDCRRKSLLRLGSLLILGACVERK